jgi:MoxR-like ATPase
MSLPLDLRIQRALRAGVRALWLRTTEEDRAIALCEALIEPLGWPVHTWSAASGVDRDGEAHPLGDLLHQLSRARPPALWLLLDGAPHAHDLHAQRALREIAQRRSGPAVVILSPLPPPDLPELRDFSLPLPDQDALLHALHALGPRLEPEHPGATAAITAAAPELARLALGLPERVLERLTAEALLDRTPEPSALIAAIAAQKPEALGDSGLLERLDPVDPELLGGLHHLKHWLARRALALRPEARAAAIPAPRGLLLVGVQGCGKSLAARVCAAALGLPLLRLDPGRLFGGTVGESEHNLRRVTELAERLAPLVLWIDEIDKGLAGADAARSDGGAAARVVGGFLTWLQERSRPVFVVATANRLDHLPPELLRRGRLDEVFFVDLPDAAARAAILQIHLLIAPARELSALPPLADPPQAFLDLAARADGYSGAELAAALIEARLDAFAEARPLAAADLERALAATIPLSRACFDEISALRAWATGAARRA